MSIIQMAMVWRYRLPFNQAWVLMALADHADDDGTNCYPAVAYVAWKTGYSDRQVRRVIKELRDIGALIPIEEGRGPGRPTHYQVHMTDLPVKEPYRRPTKYLSPADRVRLISLYERTCAYCGMPGTATTGPDSQAWHIDRIIPGSKGGTYEDANVALACGTCNRRKGANLAHPTRVPSATDHGTTVTPIDAIVKTIIPDAQEATKPSSTTIQPSGEPSVYSDGLDRIAWTATLRGIDGWGTKGEPHMDSLLRWISDKGWTLEQLEASAIGLAATSEKTLKGYRDMAAAFERRLNQGFDDPRRHGDNGRRTGAVPATSGGPDSGQGGGWGNRD